MSIPATILLILYALHLLVSAFLHGKVQLIRFSFWSTLLGVAVTTSLLAWGGFFS